MDKKNTTIGVLLLLAAFASLYFSSKLSPPPPPAPELVKPASGSTTAPNQAPTPGTTAEPATSPANAAFAAVTSSTNADAHVLTLANDFVELHLTDFGGAVQDVAFKKYPAVKGHPEPYVFNQKHADPMLAFVDFPGLGRDTRYEVVSATATEVVFRANFENRVEVIRRFALPTPGSKTEDPYQIRHEITFRNLTAQTQPLPRAGLSLGTAAPVNAADVGLHLSTSYNDGKDIVFVDRANLEGGGLLSWIGMKPAGPIPSIEHPAPIVWASVKNQFFASILTPDQPGTGLTTRRVDLGHLFSGDARQTFGITGVVGFNLPTLPANGEAKLGFSFYTGPKEYKRLANSEVFKHDQDKVMKFGIFKFFSQILLSMMTAIHGWVGNWGLAIVLTTLTLKTVFLPLTLAASKSAKRMQKVQPEMQAIREKYKDNPQKLNQATMEIFKKHKVNPMGGCLPVLITIPFFMGFFSMLQSTAELRFAEFLWSNDLSAPDTVAHLLGFPINIMPVLMGTTMIFQMRLTPQPTIDNAQAKMFKFMPYIFAIFCYNFSAALSLYSTVNGIFTIGQQLIINRMKDDDVTTPGGAAVTTASTLGKAMKNVTPTSAKKKR